MIWWVAIPALFLAYTYAVYPLGMALRAKWAGRPVSRGPWRGRAVALLSARGEGARLAEKVRELAEGAAVSGLSAVRVGLDGGSGADAEALRTAVAGAGGAAGCAVEVEAFPRRCGKSAVLAALMARGGADAWVMADVRQRVEPEAIRTLLEHLADPAVAVASGELRFRTPENASAKRADGYWSFEKRLREAEGRVWAVPGATGALYAIRAADAEPPPEGVVLDDVWIPMRAVMRGKRCVFVRGAVAWDSPEADALREAARKRRTNAGVWQLAGMMPGVLSPWRNPSWGAFWSHKMFRLLTPFAVAAGWAGLWGMAWTERSAVWAAAAVLAGAGMAVSAAAHAWGGRLRGRWAGWLGAPWGVNAMLAGAAWDAWRGRYRGQWRG